MIFLLLPGHKRDNTSSTENSVFSVDSVFGTCYKGAMKCSNQVNFHTFVSSIRDLMSQRYVEVKWIVINMAELLKIIQFGHICHTKPDSLLIKFPNLPFTLIQNFYVEPVLLKALIFNALLNDGYPKRGTGNDVRC